GTGGPHSARTSTELLTKTVDTSKEARRGGSFETYRSIDVLSFDTAVSTQGSLSALGYAYSRLFYITPGYLGPTKYEISGDLAESWEWSSDNLSLTMKLRPNAGTAPVAPLNGRLMDADDVMYSL